MRTLLAIAPHSLKSDDLDMIERSGVGSLVIFSTHDNDSSIEIQQKLEIPTSIFSVTPLTTDGYENSDQLQALSWNISKQMFQSVNGIDGPKDVLLGSGTALHDYLLWLVACSVKCENFYHWEGYQLEPYLHNEQYLDSNVAPKIMSALLQLSGSRNSKVFSAQDICELDNITEMAGVQSAATALHATVPDSEEAKASCQKATGTDGTDRAVIEGATRAARSDDSCCPSRQSGHPHRECAA